MIEKWVQAYEGDPEFEFDLLAIEVGELIVERMEELGMTRTELATAVGVSKARISQILSGHDNLTLKSLVAVAVGLESRIELRLKSAAALDAPYPAGVGMERPNKRDSARVDHLVNLSVGGDMADRSLAVAA